MSEGRPVPINRLAAASSWPIHKVETILRPHPGAEWDEDGKLVGFGPLTLHCTPHRFSFEGRTVYGTCAGSVVALPALLDRAGIIESICPVTAEPVRLTVTPERIGQAEPADAVMAEGGCDGGRILSSRRAAVEWLSKHPDVQIHELQEALEVRREQADRLRRRGAWPKVVRR